MNTSHKQSSGAASREKSSGLSTFKKFTAISVVGLAAAISMMTAASDSRVAYITDGSQTYTVTTANNDTNGIIEKAGIELSYYDEAVVTEESHERIDINIIRAFPVKISADGGARFLEITGGTVSDALEAAGVKVSANDIVTPSLSTELLSSTEIEVVRGIKIYLECDGETSMMYVPEGKIGEVLLSMGYELIEGWNDGIDFDTPAANNMTVRVDKVLYRTAYRKEKTQPVIIEELTDTLPLGETQVKQQGKEGTVEIAFKEKYVNGVLEEQEEFSRKVTVKSVNEIILVGTKVQQETVPAESEEFRIDNENGIFADFGIPKEKTQEVDSAVEYEVNDDYIPVETDTLVSTNNIAGYSYSMVMVGVCTAYTELDGITATGTLPRIGTVAVNPDVIPYGTRLYICSADGSYVYGYAVAEDTGTACMDGDILVDLYMNSEADCEAFGRQELMIYVLD